MVNPNDRYFAVGKEVLIDQAKYPLSHYADAVNEEAAIAIAYALNSLYLAKLGPVDRKAPCRTCKGVEIHHANCVQRFDNVRNFADAFGTDIA